MTSIAKLLKQAIERTAKKQMRSETEALRRASARYRRAVADLDSRTKKIERQLAFIRKQLSSPEAASAPHDRGSHRFSAKGLQSLRRKLALSKTECGRLLGVSAREIGKWEKGLSRPTEKQVGDLAAIRKIGKREARLRLAETRHLKK